MHWLTDDPSVGPKQSSEGMLLEEMRISCAESHAANAPDGWKGMSGVREENAHAART